MTDPAAEASRLAVGAEDVLPEGRLAQQLEEGRPLRVKLGIDVTAPDVTLGHGVPLQRMAAFQRAGHVGVLIVGDYTARIGDPSGRSAARPILSEAEIDLNAKRYFEHASTIIDPARTEVRFNGEWLRQLDYREMIRITRTTTVARMLERDDFGKRFAAREPVSISELLYPLMQAYDSVAVEADVELGGNDQLYNLLIGRDLMEAYGLDPQVVLTVELMLSWDETLMSASRGNYVGLREAPEEQFGKVMRIPDSLLPQWYRLVMESDEDPLAGNPMEAKLALASFVVRRAWGDEAARAAEEHFTRVVREGKPPEQVSAAKLPPGDPIHLPALLVEQFGLSSTSEARRLLDQGGVKLDGEVTRELDVSRRRLEGALVQVGRRRFRRFREA